MNSYGRFFMEFLTPFFDGLVLMFKSFFSGLLEMFNLVKFSVISSIICIYYILNNKKTNENIKKKS